MQRPNRVVRTQGGCHAPGDYRSHRRATGPGASRPCRCGPARPSAPPLRAGQPHVAVPRLLAWRACAGCDASSPAAAWPEGSLSPVPAIRYERTNPSATCVPGSPAAKVGMGRPLGVIRCWLVCRLPIMCSGMASADAPQIASSAQLQKALPMISYPTISKPRRAFSLTSSSLSLMPRWTWPDADLRLGANAKEVAHCF